MTFALNDGWELARMIEYNFWYSVLHALLANGLSMPQKVASLAGCSRSTLKDYSANNTGVMVMDV